MDSLQRSSLLCAKHTLCLSGRLEDLRLPHAWPQTRPDARTQNLSKDFPRHKVVPDMDNMGELAARSLFCSSPTLSLSPSFPLLSVSADENK